MLLAGRPSHRGEGRAGTGRMAAVREGPSDGSDASGACLRIAMLAPIAWRVPPRHYGPWELFASLLTEGLVAGGHDVTLFATGDSQTAAKLSSVVPRGWSDESDDPEIEPKVAECLHIAGVFERAADFDVIHNGFDFLPLAFSGLVDTPVVTTIHGFSSPRILPVYERYNDSTAYVAISDADRHPRLDYAATIHHGIDTDAFALHPSPGGYLLFFGRIHPDKGTATAIEVARRAGLPLVIAGIIQDQAYFDAAVAPHLGDDRVRFVGAIGAEQRSEILGGAHALLHLIDFDEPFGFSVVEAMACGTPVVAFDRGSMRELIDPGLTGSVVDDEDQAVVAVAQVGSLDRRRIRERTTERFGYRRMVDAYVAVYEQVLGTG
jgi:glycosyltransferase involved in cell wall biosynthesis